MQNAPQLVLTTSTVLTAWLTDQITMIHGLYSAADSCSEEFPVKNPNIYADES